ncbi:hypothetical protein B0H34DRAFT_673794 [Crassisporium funariophilum]|nr:hypothetical protein B0H34DRAFT_673794 [Crassisporium funariophilum]
MWFWGMNKGIWEIKGSIGLERDWNWKDDTFAGWPRDVDRFAVVNVVDRKLIVQTLHVRTVLLFFIIAFSQYGIRSLQPSLIIYINAQENASKILSVEYNTSKYIHFSRRLCTLERGARIIVTASALTSFISELALDGKAPEQGWGKRVGVGTLQGTRRGRVAMVWGLMARFGDLFRNDGDSWRKGIEGAWRGNEEMRGYSRAWDVLSRNEWINCIKSTGM